MKTVMSTTKTCVILVIGFAIGFYAGAKYENVYQIHWEPGVSDDFNEKMRQLSQRMDANHEEYQKARRIRNASQ